MLSSHLLSAGMKELSPPPLNLRRLYAETMEWEPVLIIISPGADPSQELAELAAETVGRDSYHEVMSNRKTREELSRLTRGFNSIAESNTQTNAAHRT